MFNNNRIVLSAVTVFLLMLAVGSAGCGDKTADPSTATATSAGKPGANSGPQQPTEQGKAGDGGAGKQLMKPLQPPP